MGGGTEDYSLETDSFVLSRIEEDQHVADPLPLQDVVDAVHEFIGMSLNDYICVSRNLSPPPS